MSHDWPVLPHGPLEQLSPRLWRVEGELPGMPLKRVMAVAKRADGKLVVHGAMAMDDAGMAALDALGPVGFIVVPNGFHRIDGPRFAKRYPEAKVLCPENAKKRVAEKTPVHGSFDDFPADPHVSLAHVEGMGKLEGVMTVDDDDGVSLVLNDSVFNMPHGAGFKGFLTRHVTGSSGGPKVSNLGKWFLVKDKAAFRGQLERLAATPRLRRVLVAHHQTIDVDPARVLRDVAAAL